ncbi:MAG: hypothetical protein HOM68_12260 [Gemmatimonadetes bacterium]|nr:hypothetical protein [Gemmatimonadota bacterium]
MTRPIQSCLDSSSPRLLLVLRLCLLIALGFIVGTPGLASAETFARVAHWVPPERHAEFAEMYEAEIVPYLEEMGFRATDVQGRATVDSVFSRLYVFDSPADVLAMRDTLRSRHELLGHFRRYGEIFGTTEWSGMLKGSFRLYSHEVGPLPGGKLGAGTQTRLGDGRGRWRTLDVTDGLAGPMVQTMLQDRLGQMWFGTKNNGVSRFDGQSWMSLGADEGLPSNDVEVLFEDSDGRLWAGTSEGLAQIVDDKVVAVFDETQGLPGRRVRAIVEGPDRTLWVGLFDGGLSNYNGTSWKSISAADDGLEALVDGLAFDTDGTLWVGTPFGLNTFDGESWAAVDLGEDAVANKGVRAILVDTDGNRWISLMEVGLARLSPDGTVTMFGDEEHGPLKYVCSLSQDSYGRIWAGTYDRGALVFEDGDWRPLNSNNGLAHNSVYQVLQDTEGFLWFATMGGASRLDEHGLTVYGDEDGLRETNIHHLRQDASGALWIAHMVGSAGVTVLADSVLTTYMEADGLAGDHVGRTYADQSGHAWVTGEGGATRIDGDSVTIVGLDQGLPTRGVYSMIQTTDGIYWFGTGYGLARYDGHRMEVFGEEDGLASHDVLALHEDREGNLWIASQCGVTRYDGESFQAMGTADGLIDEYVADITSGPDGRIWFATHGGVAVYDGESFKGYTTDDGLTSNDVHAVVADGDDLWVGTDGGGISRFDGNVFQSLTAKDGLPDNVSLTVAVADEGIWVGGSAGLSFYRPGQAIDVPVLINAVVAGRRFGLDEKVEVASTVELMAFEFRGISLKTLPGQTVFCYRLVGHDDEWYHTRANRVEYTDLPRGDYRFEVQAVDRDLNYSAAPASIDVVVRLPYERIAWGMCLVLALGLIVW